MKSLSYSYQEGFSSAGKNGIGFLPQAAENRLDYTMGYIARKVEDIATYLRSIKNSVRIPYLEIGEARIKKMPENLLSLCRE